MQQGHCFRRQALNRCGLAPPTNAVTNESGSIAPLELVRRHHGDTLVPGLAVLDEGHANPLLKRFAGPAPVREVSLVRHHGFGRAALLTALHRFRPASVPDHRRPGALALSGGSLRAERTTCLAIANQLMTLQTSLATRDPQGKATSRNALAAISFGLRRHRAAI